MNRIEQTYRYWLDSRKSEGTKKVYENSVVLFFKMVYSKKISELVNDDFLINNFYRDKTFKKFVEPMRRNGVKDETIKNYLSGVSSFITALEKNMILNNVDYNYIRRFGLAGDTLIKDGGEVPSMSVGEFDELIEFLKEYKFKSTANRINEKYMAAAKLMFCIASHISATFRLKWSDIVHDRDFDDNEFWVIYVHDKGNKVNKKPIADKMYYELKELLYEGNQDDTLFHDVSQRNFAKIMELCSEKTGHKITPQSLKVGAGTRLYNLTKDPDMVRRFLDHESLDMTTKYIRSGTKVTDFGSYILTAEIEPDRLDEIPVDVLRAIIKESPNMVLNITKRYDNIRKYASKTSQI
ncbi:site-specific integrase [Lapidilactobacillus luobeiensis]|uniref:site-specific integrase n=1 Tax=Lapidilactobacillus luobeiensis TaxID=2950371 RepID=UPI0021C3D135|nr:site-specific integrase [Lapidilactobacillus luobeiensis]